MRMYYTTIHTLYEPSHTPQSFRDNLSQMFVREEDFLPDEIKDCLCSLDHSFFY